MFSIIGKSISRLVATVEDGIKGPNQLRQLLYLLEDGDETKAHELYLEILNDPSFSVCQVNPSEPYKFIRNNDNDTLLHVAARKGLLLMVRVFLEKGADPNVHNTRSEAMLHSLCSCPNNDSGSRQRILDYVQNWRSVYVSNGLTEDILINHLNIDGNSPVHLAASNGLRECVKRLVDMGSNLSIVNKDQLTCCELAEEKGFFNISDMLELALLFPLSDESDIFAAAQGGGNGRSDLLDTMQSTIFNNNKSFQTEGNVGDYIDNVIEYVGNTFNTLDSKRFKPTSLDSREFWTYERIEAILNEYLWDVKRLVDNYRTDGDRILKSAKGTNADLEIQVSSTCSICMDDMNGKPISDVNEDLASDLKPSLKCGHNHIYCKDCWLNNSRTQVDSDGSFVLSCPGYKCKQILDHRKFGKYLLSDGSNNSRYSKFLNLRVRNVINCYNNVWKCCPATNCSSILICENVNNEKSQSDLNQTEMMLEYIPTLNSTDRGGGAGGGGGSASTMTSSFAKVRTTAICGNYHTICISCQGPAHALVSCDQFEKWKKVIAKRIGSLNIDTSSMSATTAAAEMADKIWLAANTKKCPNCESAIEKNDGCNHMTCRKCRYEFCWICMQRWSLHSMNTGGSFQCNINLANTSQKDAKAAEEDDDILKDIGTSSGGNAKAETARLKLVAKNTSIFLPYFTRFKAHDDSLKMEIGRMPVTFERIKKCLIESYQNLSQSNIVPVLDGSKSTSSGSFSANALKVEAMRSFSAYDEDRGNSHKTVIWLQGDRVVHPLEIACQIRDSTSTMSNNSLSRSSKPFRLSHSQLSKMATAECLKFLSDGFKELIKCRETLKGIAMYSYFTFGKTIADSTTDSGAPVDNLKTTFPFKAVKGVTGTVSSMLLISCKANLDRLSTELEKYTEMLSDVVARKRLRASNFIITNMVELARDKRMECEDCITAYESSVAPDITKPSQQNLNNNEGFLGKYMDWFGAGSKQSLNNAESKPPTPPLIKQQTSLTLPPGSVPKTVEDDFDIAVRLSLEANQGRGGGGIGSSRTAANNNSNYNNKNNSNNNNNNRNGNKSTGTAGSVGRQSTPDLLNADTLDQNIATLVSMGFERDIAHVTLLSLDNDLDRALNSLL